MHKKRYIFFFAILTCLGIIGYVYTQHTNADARHNTHNQLLTAFCDNNIDTVLGILKQHPSIVNEFIRWDCQTPLIVTILFNNDGSLDTILSAILHNPALIIDQKTSDSNTALIFAAQYSNAATVQQLLEHGADPFITDDDGHTALSHVYQRYYARIESQRYASQTAGNISHQSSLDIENYKTIIQLLLNNMKNKQPDHMDALIDKVGEQYTLPLKNLLKRL